MKEPGVKLLRGEAAWEELIVINSMVFLEGGGSQWLIFFPA